VSRSGKTPLSVVLAQTMGLKVANVPPLVVEVPPPKELLDATQIDPTRVFCLTIAPGELRRIRTTRLERRNVKDMEAKYELEQQKSNYADRAYLLNDLKHARTLATTTQGWTEIDVTGRAVEETASYIVELLNDRFHQGQELSAKHLS
jgi:regulator of PEP synthase PpsR (kinase-PPPase family)